MPKYLWKVSYTAQGAQGVLREGGTGRQTAVAKMVEDLGGSVECFYFAFGEDDAYVIADLPDNATAAAVSMTVGAAGAVQITTVPLLGVDEVDAAAAKSIGYRAPGA